MNILNKYFDKIYCVNLDRRPDKWIQFESEIKKFNLDVQRISAVDGTNIDLSNIKMTVLKKESFPGIVGCTLSHINILKDAKKNNYSKILILEDDVVFIDNLIERFENEVSFLPENWDMFYLSGNNLKPEALTQINKHFYKTEFTYTTHCYAVNSKVYDVMIEGLEKLEVPVDQFFKDSIQKNYNCYIIRPHLSWQRAGYSDIMLGNRDYVNIRK